MARDPSEPVQDLDGQIQIRVNHVGENDIVAFCNWEWKSKTITITSEQNISFIVLLGVSEWDICRSVRHSFVYSPTRGTYWPSFFFCAISYPRIPSWGLSLLEEYSSREQPRKTSRRQSYGRIVAIPRSSECSPGAEIRYPGSRLGRTRLAKVIQNWEERDSLRLFFLLFIAG